MQEKFDKIELSIHDNSSQQIRNRKGFSSLLKEVDRKPTANAIHNSKTFIPL